MILVVAERVHNPKMPPEKVQKWAELWRQAPLRCVFLVQGMAWGPTRNRLAKLLGRQPDRVVNLLPPDSACGTWDAQWAREVAQRLRVHLEGGDNQPYMKDEDGVEGPITHIVLCGRRVMDAWFPQQPSPEAEKYAPGMTWEWRQIRHMWIPHPSGRNRVWNDVENVERVQASARDFFSDLLPSARSKV